MKVTDEILSAFLDRELGEETEAEVRSEIAKSPKLKQRLAALKEANEEAAGFFKEIDKAPLSEGVQATLARISAAGREEKTGGNVLAFRRAAAALPARLGSWSMAAAASIALVAGFGAGLLVSPGFGPGNADFSEDRAVGLVLASSPLYQALETAPSGASRPLGRAESAIVTPVLSFRSAGGTFCREVVVSGGEAAMRGLYCKESDDAWRILVTEAVTPAPEGVYLPASGETGAVDAAIDMRIAGDPLGHEEEQRLIEQNWRPETK